MRTVKLLTGLAIVTGALRGIYTCFLKADEESTSQMAVFTLTMLAGAWILARPWRKVYRFIIVLFLLQLFALKTNNIDYAFGLGISMVQYFRLVTFKPDHLFFSGSYANLSLDHSDDKALVGINFMALAFLATLIYLRNKQKSLQ